MLYGYLVGEMVVLTDQSYPGARLVTEVDPPVIPEGYKSRCEWIDDGISVRQTWIIEPIEGTPTQAALKLAQMQAISLPDAQALEVSALYPEWAEAVDYVVGDRVRHYGVLYKCLQAHTSQAGWDPQTAASLWAKVLPGQEGNEPEDGSYAEWVKPDSTNGYSTGNRVTHNGHLWESIVDSNVDEPGTDNGFRWKDLGEWPAADDQNDNTEEENA